MSSLPPDRLIDSFGRPHNNLRISVTDRCNIRCVYCMPEQVEFLPRAALLSFEEIERFVRIAVTLGINKVRLTGGEPLVRRDIPALVEKLAAIPGLVDIGLTTNGILLAPMAKALRDAGLERINVSLDTMDAAKFRAFDAPTWVRAGDRRDPGGQGRGFSSGEGQCDRHAGSDRRRCRSAGRVCPDSWPGTAIYRVHAARRGPSLGARKGLVRGRYPRVVGARYRAARAVGRPGSPAPALDYEYADGGGRVGFIASISRPFCMSCNRIRLTSDGKLRNCLFSLEETDIRGLLRGDAPDAEIVKAIRDSVASKWEGHEINTARFIQPERLMHSIGG